MQTFLPYADFEQSARVLDPKRLGKQRVEVIQVVRALTWPGYGWAHHPAVLMWKGHEEALGSYGLTCCRIWTELGHGDTCAATIVADLESSGVGRIRTQRELAAAGALPEWLGDANLHLSHQSALLRKDGNFYGPRFPGVSAELPYRWPVRSQNVVDAERRKAQLAVVRAERAAARAERAAEQAKKRRSQAAKRGWKTRRANR
ncbi:MAG: MSMEG_6728 family protein [Actinomycetota bacterium]|nr:MSMEG_6728 family protein [Actinomycetota bacterium]